MTLGGVWKAGRGGKTVLGGGKGERRDPRSYGTCSVRGTDRRPTAQEKAGEVGEPRLLGHDPSPDTAELGNLGPEILTWAEPQCLHL